MRQVSPKKVNKICVIVGLLVVLFMGLPYLLLGEEAIVTYHDQLDGELIAYLLQAKYLFQGKILPEFMNGVAKTALLPPAPACVLLFLGGNGFIGLVCMQVLGSVCGYLGMYLLVREVAGEACAEDVASGENIKEKVTCLPVVISVIGMAVGVMYAYLPFLPVYGLAQYGLPLLVWCLLQAKKGCFVKTAYLYAMFYALNSSLVLVGFGVLGSMLLWIVWQERNLKSRKSANVDKEIKGKNLGNASALIGIWVIMLFIYIVENRALLMQTFGIGGEPAVSHKAEYVLKPDGFFNSFWQGLVKGGQHSEDYHYLFLIGILMVVSLGLLYKVGKRLAVAIGICLGWNVFFALVAAVWDSGLGIAFRSKLSALGAFQMNRLLWIAPCFWYLAFGCGLVLAVKLIRTSQGKVISWKNGLGVACCVLLTCMLGVTGVKVLLESNLKPNIQKLRNSEYGAFSFKDYYAIGVLEQVEGYLHDTTGNTQDEYRVVSLGIDPAAALYHGFYCLDGYSNNYPLEYKHRFREIIAPELAKSAYIQDGFDNWGNRCYLFSAECPGYYTIEKNGFYFADYTLDVESLKVLGDSCPIYLLSAAYIQNAEENGLVLLRQEPFETEDSYYRIFLYGLE